MRQLNVFWETIVWKAVPDLCAKQIRSTIVFMCSFHLFMCSFHLVIHSLHLSYVLFSFGYVLFSFRYMIILFGYALFSFDYVIFSFCYVLLPLYALFMDKMDNSCMDMGNSSGIYPEGKFVHILTIIARHREISHSPRYFILKNLLSKEGGSYGQVMAYRSHHIKSGIRYYSKLLGFYS